ncbi:MAG: glycosyltransferase family 4 protein [Phascolarctobacterium sp.]|nr:glycosyltransferase family 4 protein [Phascolarctobacterium sp.]
MKVLLYDTFRVIDAKGGTEKVFCNMANALVNLGYEVTALIFENKKGKPFFPLDSRVELINAGIGFNSHNLINNFIALFSISKHNRHIKRYNYKNKRIAEKIRPYLSQINPDVIISFTVEGTAILKNFVRTSKPVITMYHFNAEHIINDNKLSLSALKETECIQTLLDRDVVITSQYINAKKFVTIPNVVPQYDKHSDLETKTIITVGRVCPLQKRQHILIEAFAKIASRYPDWQVEIYGETHLDKEYFDSMQEFIRKNKLKNIKFCGTTNDIVSKLKEASIFAFPSAFEGFPLALTEAMSMGLASVGFRNCPAVNEIIKDGHNGILCEASINSFSEALSKLMSDYNLRLKYGSNAREDMKCYAPEVIWNKWDAVIKEVYKENKNSQTVEVGE